VTNARSEVATAAQDTEPAVPWTPVGIVLVGMFMAILDSFIVVVAGPAIRADLGSSAGALEWVLAGYQLSYGVLMITGGRLADMFGRKRIFVLGAGVFVLASIACALAQNSGTLIAARVVLGVGAALMVPQVFAIIAIMVPAAGRHRVFGVVGIVIGLASAGGQLIGGLLISANLFDSSWRSVFWVNVPIGLVTIALALRFVPESRSETKRRLDVPGVLVLTLALLLLTFPLIEGRDAGWPWWTWGCFAGAVLVFALFAAVERSVDRRGGDPLMRLSLFRQRSFSLGIVLVTAVYALLSSYYLALSVSMQDGLGLSALESGLVYAPTAITFLIFGLVASRLVPKYGRRVLEVGSVILAAGYLASGVVLLAGARITPLVVIPPMVLQAVGGGLLITPLLNTVLGRLVPATVGMASGALSTAQQIGGALGVAVIGAVYFNSFHPETDGLVAAAGHAFAYASIGVFVIAAIASVLVFALPDAAKPAPPAAPDDTARPAASPTGTTAAGEKAGTAPAGEGAGTDPAASPAGTKPGIPVGGTPGIPAGGTPAGGSGNAPAGASGPAGVSAGTPADTPAGRRVEAPAGTRGGTKSR
jgi:EmrB/QacA subfamily drug resistance transporter